MPYISCAKCQDLIPPTAVVEGKRRSLNRRKYCLSCSPFGLRNTRKLDGSKRRRSTRTDIYAPKSSEALLAQARELHFRGFSARMISAELKVSKATVGYWVKQGWIPSRSHAEAMKLAVQSGRMRGAEDWSEESRVKQRENMLKRIAKDPMNHPNRRLAGNRKKMTFPEKLVFDTLTEANIPFEHNRRIDRYYPDFTIGTKILEVDGERWHNSETDATRDSRLLELGYQVIRVPAKEILKNPRIILDRLQVLQKHLPFGAEGTRGSSEVADHFIVL